MKKLTPFWPTQHEVDQWYQVLPGKYLANTLQQQLDQLLSNVFGYYAVCLGQIPGVINLNSCRISKKFFTTPIIEANNHAVVDFGALPFAENTIDLFIMPQGFDFLSDYQSVLNEVSRCLISQGRLLILGFNLRSLFGLWQWLQGDSQDYPWRSNFYSFSKIKKMLIENNFEIEAAETFYFRPPFNQQGALEKLKFVEVLGPLLWRDHGAMYAILVRKQAVCLTPIRPIKAVTKKSVDLITAHRVKTENN